MDLSNNLGMATANRNVTKGDATRERLVEVATELFGEHGYEATSVESVLRVAGVSRGSLYHHFASKGALFAAVVESVEERVGAEVAAAATGAVGAVEVLRRGGREWIRLAGDPVVQRVLLIDAPSVLGWEEWRQVEERHALGLVKAILESAASEGLIETEMVDMMGHVLLAAVNEIALLVARAGDPATATRLGSKALDEILGSLFSGS
jgi:AcrR family transcriptional regulator